MTSNELQIASTLVGFCGTLIMFRYGNTSFPTEGGIFGSEEVNESDRKIELKNKTIQKAQSLGFGLLTLSFLGQFISYFL